MTMAQRQTVAFQICVQHRGGHTLGPLRAASPGPTRETSSNGQTESRQDGREPLDVHAAPLPASLPLSDGDLEGDPATDVGQQEQPTWGGG